MDELTPPHGPVGDCDCGVCATHARDRLRRFAQALLAAVADGAADGAGVLALAESHGLVTRVSCVVPCGERCRCAEQGAVGGRMEGYRHSELLGWRASASCTAIAVSAQGQ